jgi:UDP-N-acetylmuramoylalanine--D-glutamate ligase
MMRALTNRKQNEDDSRIKNRKDSVMDQDSFHRLLGKTAAARLVKARQQNLSEHQSGSHSLELVATVSGVDYFNDSRSTHLEATLQAMSNIDKPFVWIAGTLPAEIGQWHIQEFLRERVAALVLYGKSSGRGIEALKPFTEHMYTAEELRTAVFVARELAREGEVVLFSPACPSGDPHANVEERGVEFTKAVRDL